MPDELPGGRQELPGLEELAGRVVAAATAAGLTLGTCESLTGGGVAQALTAVPGASVAFRGGLVTYASELKTTLAGVDARQVAEHGVVNEYTAAAMARGARERLGVDVAGACTGVAGPSRQDDFPAGTVWIATAGPGDHDVTTRLLQLQGDRREIRHQTVGKLLELILAGVISREVSLQD